MIDINGSEFLIIAILALVLVGPERLPEYVRGLRALVRRVRSIIKEGQSQLQEEMGGDVDWNTLDPRQYDPRRIVREALFEDEDATPATGTAAVAAVATGTLGTGSMGTRRSRRGARRPVPTPVEGAAPYDPEAT